MSLERRFFAIWAVFTGAAFIGPILFLDYGAEPEIVVLWPTCLFLFLGGTSGVALALAGNVLVYSVIGLLAAVAATRRLLLTMLAAVVVGLTGLALLWVNGFVWEHALWLDGFVWEEALVGLCRVIPLQLALFFLAGWLARR